MRSVILATLLSTTCPCDGPAGSTSSSSSSSAEGVCAAAPGVAADDPCCAVHLCLNDAGAAACSVRAACNALVDEGVVCGDQLCDGLECSFCVDPEV